MTADISVRAYTGSGAGTESSALAGVVLSSVDDADSTDPVAPGTRSFERWLRLRLDTAPEVGVANFWVQNDGDLSDGVSLLFGVTDTPATPVATASAIATMTLTSGRRYIFDANTYTGAGEHTRYLVIQEVAASDAATGDIPEQALSFGYVER